MSMIGIYELIFLFFVGVILLAVAGFVVYIIVRKQRSSESGGVVCSNCGSNNPKGNKFCGNCGNSL
ncbi:MAG: zinc-ribbon domain-containing protein [Anaerolineales bacterium]